MAYAMCHNLISYKIDDEDPVSICKKKNSKLFHLPHIIMQIIDFYGNIKMAYNDMQMVKYLLTIDFMHTCN